MNYKLLEVFGIELEYMIVDKDSLMVKPIADQVFEEINSGYTNVIENQVVDWSNELVAHVIEVKNNKPEPEIWPLLDEFKKEVRRINQELDIYNAQLMPSAMHPLMNPDIETRLWPHENNEIYSSYDRIFGCKGHGWSNLQSLHINISFDSDEEFRKLHSAIRFLLPLVPALSSSSPIVEGKLQKNSSSRLGFYLQNQRRIPSIIGKAIPELIKSKQEYQEKVLEPMYADIRPLDTLDVLQEEWLNSRGAIPKFERGCIEIRLADVQECPQIDLAIALFWVKAIKTLVNEEWIGLEKIEAISTDILREALEANVKEAESAKTVNLEYLSCFGFTEEVSAKDLLKSLFERLDYAEDEYEAKESLSHLLEIGSLSTRIKSSLQRSESIESIYQELCKCLAEGKFFEN
ncbi:MAG: glutamate-cysteine ligase family protein [Bdellovibrionota bacterium]|nr:glutamate-cysteine ligase family protein [Bdellovibrionota bacterium]